MDSALTIVSETRLPFGAAQLVDWQWPTPLDVTVREDRHMIEMSLPPLATDGVAAFPDISPQRFSFIGSLFMRPAGVTIRARSAGGHIRVVRLAVEPERFPALAGKDIDMREDALRAALDLREAAPRTLLHRIREELTAPGFASEALIEAYAAALVIETMRSLDKAVDEKRDGGRLAGWQYRRVRERIEAAEPLPSVSELADLCGVSLRHFLRLFRALTGEGVAEHIGRVRRDRACDLLKDRAVPLKEIAVRLGFLHASSFSAAFRREMGISPSSYRKQNMRN